MNLRPSCTRATFVLLLGLAAASVRAEPYQLAQAEIRIPSDAQLERMERQGIVTPRSTAAALGAIPALPVRTARWRSKLVGSMRSSWTAASAATARRVGLHWSQSPPRLRRQRPRNRAHDARQHARLWASAQSTLLVRTAGTRRRSTSMRYPITCTCPTWRSGCDARLAGRSGSTRGRTGGSTKQSGGGEVASSPLIALALDLEPRPRAPRAIGRIPPFRDDPLKPESAGVPQHHRAITLDRRAEP